MNEYNEMCRIIRNQGKWGLHVIDYPSGKWGFVGTIPIELCHKTIVGFQSTYVSNVYDTKEDAIADANKHGYIISQ